MLGLCVSTFTKPKTDTMKILLISMDYDKSLTVTPIISLQGFRGAILHYMTKLTLTLQTTNYIWTVAGRSHITYYIVFSFSVILSYLILYKSALKSDTYCSGDSPDFYYTTKSRGCAKIFNKSLFNFFNKRFTLITQSPHCHESP